eukprot:UN07821
MFVKSWISLHVNGFFVFYASRVIVSIVGNLKYTMAFKVPLEIPLVLSQRFFATKSFSGFS